MKKFLLTSAATKFVTAVLFVIVSFLKVDAQESMRATLYLADASGLTLLDGNLTDYGNNYCNCVDWDDAGKFSNPGENIGIERDGQTLIIERRKIAADRDTTSFRLWNLQQNRNYQLVIFTQNITNPNMIAYVKDNYTGSLSYVNLNENDTIAFTLNSDPASQAPGRFQVIYDNLATGVLPVSFTCLKATNNTGKVLLTWNVENEVMIKNYSIEKSLDGRKYSSIHTVPAGNNARAVYQATDLANNEKLIYYRIKAMGTNGAAEYSEVAKIITNDDLKKPSFSVYPNPVAGNTITFRTTNIPAGSYTTQLFCAHGKTTTQGKTEIIVAAQESQVQLRQVMAAGAYWLVLTGNTGNRISTIVNVL